MTTLDVAQAPLRQFQVMILLGNLTQAPAERQTNSEKTVAQMCLAIDRPPKKDGPDAGTDYVNVTVFGALADSCLRYLNKGRPIFVDGHLNNSQWTADGARRQKIEIHAHRITFLSRGSQVGAEEQEAGPVAADVGAADDGEDIPF